MKIYVAGASAERGRAATMMAALRKAGHTITFDWVADMAAVARPDVELSEEELYEHASRDCCGIYDADLFVYLEPETRDRTDALVEFGIAVCLDMPILIVLPSFVALRPRPRGIFWARRAEIATSESYALGLIASGFFGS